MNGGICEFGIVRINANRVPLLRTTGVIYVTKTRAIIERIITNTRYAVGDYSVYKFSSRENIFSYLLMTLTS